MKDKAKNPTLRASENVISIFRKTSTDTSETTPKGLLDDVIIRNKKNKTRMERDRKKANDYIKRSLLLEKINTKRY